MHTQPYHRYPITMVRLISPEGGRSSIDEMVVAALRAHRKECWSLQTRDQLHRLLLRGVIATLRRGSLVARPYALRYGYMVVAYATLVQPDGSVEDVRYQASSDEYELVVGGSVHVPAETVEEMRASSAGDTAGVPTALRTAIAAGRQVSAPEWANGAATLVVDGGWCSATLERDGMVRVTSFSRSACPAGSQRVSGGEGHRAPTWGT